MGSNNSPLEQGHLDLVAQYHVQKTFEYLQEGRFHDLSRVSLDKNSWYIKELDGRTCKVLVSPVAGEHAKKKLIILSFWLHKTILFHTSNLLIYCIFAY